MICSPSINLHIPGRNQIRSRLLELSSVTSEHILDYFPPDSRMSIALDCWTSPHQKPFMAITGYFIDSDWNYQEILLGFPPLQGDHSGKELARVVASTIRKFQLGSRILGITTDNASNNTTMFAELTQILKDELNNEHSSLLSTAVDPNFAAVLRSAHHIPCLTHVIQLSVKAFLDELRITPKNDNVQFSWDKSESRVKQKGIIGTLEKV